MNGTQWAFIGVFFVLALLFPALPIVLGHFMGPRRPNPIKNDVYECGLKTYGTPWVPFKVQFYLFALVFLIFDVELVFLYPWAVAYGVLPMFAVFEGILFILMLAAALVYAWKREALDWYEPTMPEATD